VDQAGASSPVPSCSPSWSSALLQSALVLARTPRDLRRGRNPSSLGIRRVCPSAVRPPMRPLPEARAPFGPTVRPVESCSALGVSHPLGGLLRIGVAGLLHPAAGYGVRRVSRCPSHRLCGDGYERSVPRAAVTLRRVPLVSSRAASLRSLPPCRFPSVLLPRGRSAAEATLAGGRSRRNPRGYLLHRPKPVQDLPPPKLGKAHSLLPSHPPPKWGSPESGLRAPRALPPSCDTDRSRYRGVG
jgi:hypothetical protein